MMAMTILSVICVGSMSYLLGRTHGYEKCDSFWEDVKKNGI